MNEADSELAAADFAARGYELTDDLKKADAVVVNTCTVRQQAENRALSQLGRLEGWKAARPGRKLFVIGCAAERLGFGTLRHKFPFIDGVIGAKALDGLSEELDKHLPPAGDGTGPTAGGETAPASIFSSPLSAYVTVMRGCSLKCTYCIVPSVRGPAAFLPEEEVLQQVRRRVDSGAREIVLLGQTVNAWREGERRFEDLLDSISSVPGVLRLRFMSPHPLYFTPAWLRAYAENPAIARHLHLPVQSGSDRILKAMRRGYTAAEYLGTLAKIRKADPDTVFSTDFIVGYPGETAADFEKTLDLVRAGRFGFAFCFKYSPRPGAPAKDAPDLSSPCGDITDREMRDRLARLLEEVKITGRDIFTERIGRIEEVLVESARRGKTSSNFNCRLDRECAPGALVRVEVTGAGKTELSGKVLP
ncbi:MAG: bifunctional enzyme involved in thiolation and methylation of tRNA [Elusimicrobia bacterium]|nr:MAG: bifunctional enzyme involved in thiolation and methylation of tRNA [Elusimicrobiota bacterium]KAF0156491.1 MAG: bifunctional enzyme involved in thiolation and methylation of tRNA [Elusimicrobiota bacterium]